MSTSDNINNNNIYNINGEDNVAYTDKRDVLLEAIEDIHYRTVSGKIQSIALVALTSDGDVECLESYKNNSDRLAILGATHILAQHIMAGDE